MSRPYQCELTTGDDKNENESYGLIIWLQTTDEKEAEKLANNLIININKKERK